jgi:hypothetical protein
VSTLQLAIPKDEKSQGTFRILSVKQRHERGGREVMLIDGESMGETKTDLRKRQFSYLIQGIADVEIKPKSWLLSPRDDLGVISEVQEIKVGKGRRRKKSQQRLALRVKFDETGIIRLNETWAVFKKEPLTRRIMGRWEKRMTEGATQYYWEILPGVIDSVLFEATEGVNGEQVREIRTLQNHILYRAIKIAKSKESLQLTSTHLVNATREVLEPLETE